MNESEKQARLKAITSSPTYLRAYEDLPFLKSKELRPIRLQLELLKPDMVLAENGIRSTIVVFGGTRILEPAEARARVAGLEADLKTRPADDALASQLAVARRIEAKSKYYEEARRFGRIVTKECQRDGESEFVIVTGGGPGVMEAANRGAYEAGGKSIGLNITLPHEQYPNPYITPDLCFLFHYFAIRKMHFLMRAKALVAFPGGYGTLDELFECLTLQQTNKTKRLPVLLFGSEFWEGAIDFDYLVEEGTIDPADTELFSFVETAEDAWARIKAFYGDERG